MGSRREHSLNSIKTKVYIYIYLINYIWLAAKTIYMRSFRPRYVAKFFYFRYIKERYYIPARSCILESYDQARYAVCDVDAGCMLMRCDNTTLRAVVRSGNTVVNHLVARATTGKYYRIYKYVWASCVTSLTRRTNVCVCVCVYLHYGAPLARL